MLRTRVTSWLRALVHLPRTAWQADAAKEEASELRQDVVRHEGEVSNLGVANHETQLLANHAAALGEEVKLEVDVVRTDLDVLAARTEGQQQLLDVLHDHEIRLARAERFHRIWTFTRWIEHADVDVGERVSVIMATRDRSSYLDRAIASVVGQRYAHWELVIVDDGSTDDTPAVLDTFDDPRIVVERVEPRGVCAARNRALDLATGSLIAYLDDDNVLDRDWLTAVVWAFDRFPDHHTLYGARVVDDLQHLLTGEPGGPPEIQFEPFDRPTLEQGNMADMGVIAHRASCGVRFDEGLSQFGDWDLFLQLTADQAPLALPAIALHYTTDAPHRLSGEGNGLLRGEPAQVAQAEIVRRKHAKTKDVERS